MRLVNHHNDVTAKLFGISVGFDDFGVVSSPSGGAASLLCQWGNGSEADVLKEPVKNPAAHVCAEVAHRRLLEVVFVGGHLGHSQYQVLFYTSILLKS